ncbi:hypothetical protein D3C71_1535160 [compost metagenome]
MGWPVVSEVMRSWCTSSSELISTLRPSSAASVAENTNGLRSSAPTLTPPNSSVTSRMLLLASLAVKACCVLTSIRPSAFRLTRPSAPPLSPRPATGATFTAGAERMPVASMLYWPVARLMVKVSPRSVVTVSVDWLS